MKAIKVVCIISDNKEIIYPSLTKAKSEKIPYRNGFKYKSSYYLFPLGWSLFRKLNYLKNKT